MILTLLGYMFTSIIAICSLKNWLYPPPHLNANLTTLAEIQSVIGQFKKTREHFLEKCHPNTTSPVQSGTLTGSVKAMATSQDFYDIIKVKFKLRKLGLWFSQPHTSKSGVFYGKEICSSF